MGSRGKNNILMWSIASLLQIKADKGLGFIADSELAFSSSLKSLAISASEGSHHEAEKTKEDHRRQLK